MDSIARWAPAAIQLLTRTIEIVIEHVGTKGQVTGLDEHRRVRRKKARRLMEDIRLLESRARASGSHLDPELKRDYIDLRRQVVTLAKTQNAKPAATSTLRVVLGTQNKRQRRRRT